MGGGNLACETVGIRKQETAGRGGHSASVTNSHMCYNNHFLTDLKDNKIFCMVSKIYNV